jgi:GNAT superfamily N-acetyltransferase
VQPAGAAYDHIEFWEHSVENPALRDVRASGLTHASDLVMEFEGHDVGVGRPAGVEVRDIRHPKGAFWPWYRSLLNEFGNQLDDGVLNQLVSRARQGTLAGRMRWHVGYLDGRPAGYTSVVPVGDAYYLDNVVTVPEVRRRGVASATVTRAVRAALDAGAACIFLLAEASGDPQRLYERIGFRPRDTVETFHRELGPAEAG